MDAAIFLDDLQAAVHAAYRDGREPEAILLHPATLIHVSDPALGLDPLAASELDAFDGLPVEIDPLMTIGEVGVRERTRPGLPPGGPDAGP